MNVLRGIHCVVPGCRNTLKKVNQWKAAPCRKAQHKGKIHGTCTCPEPYRFFKFPDEIKLRKLWLERVNRTDLEVNNLTRVCSFHFVNGRPTRSHYFPDINLKRECDEDVEIFEDDVKQEIDADEEKPPTLSIIPMEYIQENDEEDGDDDGHLGISNSVTISRVSGGTHASRNSHALSPRKRARRHNNDDEAECPFEIEMVSDEEDDEESEFSDEIEMIECTPLTGVRTVKSQVNPKLSSPSTSTKSSVPRIVAVTTTNNPTPVTNAKPKVVSIIPPASFIQQGTNVKVIQTFQPIITKVNSAATSVQIRPVTSSASGSASASSANAEQRPASQAIVATNGTAPAKPVATYDPSKQQLQIANPIKYIQDCHNRIAELLAEKNKMETKNIELDAKYRQAIARNRQLEAKIKDLEQKKATSTTSSSQQLTTPTFNLIPSLAQGILINGSRVVNSSTFSSNGNANTNAGSPAPAVKRRFIQVIRN